jgi:rod shape-determining protein MreB
MPMASESRARKKKSIFSLERLRSMVSDSLAIDMGSTSTIIAVHGRGIVLDEPSVVALNKLTGEAQYFGYEAQQMQGREAREITVVSPLVDGVVADWEVTQAMLDHFVRSARSGFAQVSRRAIMSVVSGITQVEQRALMTAVEKARIRNVYLVEEGLAAALGAGVRPDDEHGSAVVDIGGSTTNVAAVAQGKIVHAHAERVGGNDINLAIIDHLRRHHGLSIGQQSAENLKIELGSAVVPEDLSRVKLVKGRDIQTGGPGASEVTAGEIYAVAHPILHQISRTVNQSLTELPSEVAADIYDRGLILTGGGALLTGFMDYLRTETRLPVRLADEPRFAIVRGLAQLFDEPALLQLMVRQEQLELLEAEAQAYES